MKLCTFFAFLTFFSKSKKHDFWRFLSGWPHFLEHCLGGPKADRESGEGVLVRERVSEPPPARMSGEHYNLSQWGSPTTNASSGHKGHFSIQFGGTLVCHWRNGTIRFRGTLVEKTLAYTKELYEGNNDPEKGWTTGLEKPIGFMGKSVQVLGNFRFLTFSLGF